MAVVLDAAWDNKYRLRAGQLINAPAGGMMGNNNFTLIVEQLEAYAGHEIERTLQPYERVRKRDKMMEFGTHALLGTVAPIVGPICLTMHEARSFAKTLWAALGLVDTAGSSGVAALDAVIGAALDGVLMEIAREIAMEAVVDAMPLFGSAITAARLSSLHRKIVRVIAAKASTLHILWITQNIHALFPYPPSVP